MRILITGASGFVGKNLASYLSDVCKVSSLSRDELNYLQLGSLNGYKAIVHLAGKAHDLKRVSAPDDYYKVNFELTKQLYDAFLQSDAKQFIFVSSVKAAADSVNGILTEDTSPDPQTHYGKSKLMAEEYIKSRPLPAGKSFYILRPSMIHGPGNKGNLNLLNQFVKKGLPYPLAAFENKRSFLSIENLCFVIKIFIESDCITSGIYNVTDDEPLATNKVVEILASSLNVKPKLWKISPVIIRFLAKAGDVLHLPLTSERLDKLTENYVVSNEKIKKAINKELPRTAIEGLTITANSFN